MSWSLARKVSTALLGILLSTMLITAAFGYYKFEDVLSSLVRSRYSFVVFTIKQKVEASLGLGFALRQQRQVQDIIELEKARDEQILGIQVYDANREVLFDTDRGAIGSRVPPAWIEPLDGQSAQPFSLSDDEALLVGLPLVNTLGKAEGAVVLRYPAAYLDRELGKLLGGLAAEFAAILAGFSILGVAASALLLRSVHHRLVSMQRALEATVSEGGEVIPGPGDQEFEARFAEFCGKAREAMEHIGDASAEVERLDRLA
ncbi:MAG: hypothetical protein NVV74_23160 [Magnetospirillum sp.]|nr:hypothetical protein [Magnetospirillum sp.]